MLLLIVSIFIGFFILSGFFASLLLFYHDNNNNPGLNRFIKSLKGFKFGPIALFMYVFVFFKSLKNKITS